MNDDNTPKKKQKPFGDTELGSDVGTFLVLVGIGILVYLCSLAGCK